MKRFFSRVAEYAFYLLIFILPWQTRWIIKEGTINGGYSEYGTYSLYASDILLVLLFFLSLFIIKRGEEPKKIERHWIAIALLEFSAFVSIFVAPDRLQAAYHYLVLLLGIGLFYLASYLPYRRLYAIMTLSVSLLIQATLAIYQFLLQDSLSSKWFGMADHDPIEAGVFVVEAMGNKGFVERWLRAYGALPHPNILGGFLVLGAVLLIVFHIYRRKADHADERYEVLVQIFREKVFANLVSVLFVVALFFSFSRSAWLSFALFLFLFIAISFIRKDFLAQKYALPLILFMGVSLFIVSYPFMNLVEARVESKGYIERVSNRERASSTSQAIEVIKDRPWTGVGIGAYPLVISQEYMPDRKSYAYQPAHNTFLLVIAETGFLAFFSFLALLVLVFFSSFSKADLIYRLPLFASLIILLFFDHWLWSLHFGVLLFWLYLGLSYRFLRLDKE
jgi:O-antigen ligase